MRIADADSAIQSVNGTGLGPSFEFLVGQFVLRGSEGVSMGGAAAGEALSKGSATGDATPGSPGRKAVLLVNHDSEAGLWASVTWRWDVTRIVEVDRASGAEVPLMDDSPFTPGLQLSLSAGAARLFLLNHL